MSDMARPSDQALAASGQAPAGLAPSGFDPSRGALTPDVMRLLHPIHGAKYSPNLWRWLNSRSHRSNRRAALYRAASGTRYIGTLFDDGWLHGTHLSDVLREGGKAGKWAIPPAHFGPMPTLIEDFWARYLVDGRCAIDPEHEMYFVGNETRWRENGDTRDCLWCGKVRQHRRRWTETKVIEREAWETASGIEAEGQDRNGLGAKHESAPGRPDPLAEPTHV